MIYVYALLITAVAYALRWYYDGPSWREEKACRDPANNVTSPGLMRGHLIVCRWTPDSDRYINQGKGEAQCWPFHARFLVGWICGSSTERWHAVTAASLILSGPALAWFAQGYGLSEVQSLAVVAGFSGLWGCFGLLVLCPVLVDAPAMLVAVVGAAIYLHTDAWYVLPLAAVLAGATKETGPIWLALMAWNPIPLVGLAVPAYRRWIVAHPGPDHDIIAHPIKSAMQYRRGTLTDGSVMLWPWGMGILALLTPTPQLWVAIGAAYLQPLVASDVTRLVQNIAPIVLCHAIAMVPEWCLPIVLGLHLFNPYQKTPMETQPVRLQGVQ